MGASTRAAGARVDVDQSSPSVSANNSSGVNPLNGRNAVPDEVEAHRIGPRLADPRVNSGNVLKCLLSKLSIIFVPKIYPGCLRGKRSYDVAYAVKASMFTFLFYQDIFKVFFIRNIILFIRSTTDDVYNMEYTILS